MSNALQVLVPVSDFERIKKEAELGNIKSQQIYDKYLEVVEEIITPIITSTKSNVEESITHHIPRFTDICIEINSLLLEQNPSIDYWFDKTFIVLNKAKERIEKIRWTDDESKKNSFQMMNCLKRYYQTVGELLRQPNTNFDTIIQTINLNDLKISLYGTALAFCCIGIMIDPKGKKMVAHKKFKPISNIGLELSLGLEEIINNLQKFIKLKTTSDVRIESHGLISVKKEADKEIIEMDIEKFDSKSIYIIEYQNEKYAVQKMDKEHIVFYDVV